MARPFLASTLPERSLVAFFTTIILAAQGSCWGLSLGVSPGPGLPLARSTSSAAHGAWTICSTSASLAGAMSRTQYPAGGACGRSRLDAVVAFVCHHDSRIMFRSLLLAQSLEGIV